MNNQTLYSGRRIKGPTKALRCEIFGIDREARDEADRLGIDMDVDESWMEGMILLDKVLFAYDNIQDGEPCTSIVFVGEESALIRMSFAEFWEIYANSQAP